MSEAEAATETAPAPSTAGAETQSGGDGFLGGSSPAPEATTESPAIFSDSVLDNGDFKEGWSEGLQEQGFERVANKAKLSKNPEAFFKSIDEALKFVGQKPRNGYPREGWSDQDIASFRQDAGVPDNAEGYDFTFEDMPGGVELQDAEAKAYAEIMHRHHIPAEAARDLAKHHLENAARQASEGQQAFDSRIGDLQGQSESHYRKEWGGGYEGRLEANQDFVKTRFGEEELNDPIVRAALSHPKVVQIVDEARRALRDATPPGMGSESINGSMSARQQAQEIMKQNPGWRNDAELSKRVSDLYALDAQKKARGR